MKLIYDPDQLKKFWSLLPPLGDTGVYFLSLSARNKYLTEEERRKYGLSRTEMFSRTLVRDKDFDSFYNKIQILEQQLNVMKTKTGWTMPSQAMVCYMNLHTSDTITATKNFMKQLPDIVFESIKDEGIRKRFQYVDKMWLTEVQKAKGDRKFLDIDFDVPDYSLVQEFIDKYNEKSGTPVKYVISTQGGWHVLLERETIEFDFHGLIRSMNKEPMGMNNEIEINKNNMVAVPGTTQAGHKVKLYNLEEETE